MRKSSAAIGFLVLIVGIPAAFFVGRVSRSDGNSAGEQFDDAGPPSAPAAVFAEGRLLPLNGLLEIATIPGDQVVTIPVEVGDSVTTGQPLAVTSREQLAELQHRLAVAARDEAREQLNQKISQAEVEVDRAQATLDQLQIENEALSPPDGSLSIYQRQIDQKIAQLARLRDVRERTGNEGLVTDQELTDHELTITQLEQELDARRRVNEQAIQSATTAIANGQSALDDLRNASLESFDVQIDLAAFQLENAKINAPQDGVILKIFAEPGELANTQPLMIMGDLQSMHCIAEVFQSSMQYIQPGQQVVLSSPALTSHLVGEVAWIDRLVGESELQDPNPLSPKDNKSANVYISLDEASTQIARDFVNLQVTIEIAITPAN